MSTAILNGVDLNPDSDITYSSVKTNNSGGKSISILNKHTMKTTLISTPLMLTWGVNIYTDEKSKANTYDLALQFPKDEYANDNTTSFLKNMQNFENKIKADAIVNCKEWFNKPKMSPDVVDALWTPILKYPKDKETGDFDYSRSPTLKVKIPYWEGEFKNVEIYNETSELVYPNDNDVKIVDLITKGSNIATIVQCGGIWCANGKFGVTFKLFQCVVKPRPSLSGKCHIVLNTDELKTLEALSDEKTQDNVVAVEESTNLVNDSSDDESITDTVKEKTVELESAPVEEVVTKKKLVKKVRKTQPVES